MIRLHRVPPSPEVMAQLYADYQRIAQSEGVTFKHYLTSIGFTNPAAGVHGMDDAAVAHHSDEDGLQLISIPDQPIHGQLRVKVLLVDFSDRVGSLPVSHYEQLLFSKETHPTGSMRDYFREVTLDKVDVVGSVHGWLRLPQEYAFYTNGSSGMGGRDYPRNAQRMAEDAVRAALDADVNFSADLDELNNGTITALFIVHAGLGAETLPVDIQGQHIWSHKWSARREIRVENNLYASTYLTVPHNCKVGVCAHELGHLAFQWEDFYDPNYDKDGQEWDGSGNWDLMAGGSYNGNGNRPCHPAGLHKSQHNWINVKEVSSSGQFTLPPYTPTSGEVLKVVSPKYRRGQYLLLENRVKRGFDSDLPGEGLLVWKVDESANMFTPDKPALLLVQADGRRHLQTPDDWNMGDAGDPFPGSSNRVNLMDSGNISTSFPEGEDSGIQLNNIQRDPATGNISLQIQFGDDRGLMPTDVIRESTSPNLAIPDNDETGIESVIDIDHTGMVRQLSVTVDITHTYIGDLRVELVSPEGEVVKLHNKEGGGTDNLQKSYSSVTNTPLSALVGSPVSGRWALRVVDMTGADVGTLNRWELAIEADKADTVIHFESVPGLAILDNNPAGVANVIHVPRPGRARSLKVAVDIDHTYIGDLRVELINPQGLRAILHNKTGGSANELKETYVSATHDVLAPLMGAAVNGDWALRVTDLATQDKGTLNAWSLEIELSSQAYIVEKENTESLDIPDDNAGGVGSSLIFDKNGTVQSLDVTVDITHSYIGDLRIELIAPSGQRTVLHNKTGGGGNDLLLQLNSSDSSELRQLVGEPINGNWVLRVADLDGLDMGTLNRWALKLAYVE
ncbi:proprotein convertase P-domain-containing protein [Pseudomonadota bacterium]